MAEKFTNEQKLNAEVQRLNFKVESYKKRLANAHDENANLESALLNQKIYIQSLEQALNGDSKEVKQGEGKKAQKNNYRPKANHKKRR